MADTQRTLAEIAALTADNVSGNISAQDLRDLVETVTPDYGALYEVANVLATTVPSVNTWVKVNGASALVAGARNFDRPVVGRLRWIGAASARTVMVTATFSMKAASSNQVVEMGISMDGADPTQSIISRKISTSGDVGSGAVTFMASGVAPNTYFELWVRNTTSSANVTIEDLQLVGIGMAE